MVHSLPLECDPLRRIVDPIKKQHTEEESPSLNLDMPLLLFTNLNTEENYLLLEKLIPPRRWMCKKTEKSHKNRAIASQTAQSLKTSLGS